MAAIIGKGSLGPVRLDVEALIETRLLIQSNSGGAGETDSGDKGGSQ